MDIINSENKHCIIMGDMNMDFLRYNTHSKTNEYLDDIIAHGFLPVISIPTRVTTHTATLIDHIYTNRPSSIHTPGVILTDVSDHYGTVTLCSNKITSPNPSAQLKCVRYFSETNINSFNLKLNETNFEEVYQTNCPNKAYDAFMKLYKQIFEETFPLKNIRVNKKFIKQQPWVTNGLLTSGRRKQKLYLKKLKFPTDTNIKSYKTYLNIYNKTKQTLKRNYFNLTLEEHKFDMKKTWSILNQAIGKHTTKSQYPKSLKVNNIEVNNEQHIADTFNSYFTNIGQTTNHNVPLVDRSFKSYLPNPQLNSMFLEPVLPSTVIETIHKLKTKSSSGHDGISTKLIKSTIVNIINPITYIINKSFETGIVPMEMKIAKVIPIFKNNDQCQVKNYRPISLLPSFSKVLERLMYNKIVQYLNQNNILYKHQYGFRAKHSTIHPIIHLLNNCAEASNKKEAEYTIAILCDLSKAFDVISHKILIHKLNIYGIRGIVSKWLENYLSGRKQFVNINNKISMMSNITCGVPQGSILGPLLYLVYVNDISRSCDMNILSFADDTTAYISNIDLHTLHQEANIGINDLFTWFCANEIFSNQIPS